MRPDASAADYEELAKKIVERIRVKGKESVANGEVIISPCGATCRGFGA